MEHANELDGDRAQQCIQRLGPKQAVRRDVERLIAATMPLVWFGSIPYDHDKLWSDSKRVEFRYLRHARNSI